MLWLSSLFAFMSLSAVHTEPASIPPVPEPSVQASRLKAINLQVLGQLQALDPGGLNGLLGRVLATYRKSLARLMHQLAVGRDEGDQSAVRLVAHTLKSSSASIGALALSDVCAAVELAIREGRAHALPELLRQLEAEAVRADGAVEQLLAGYPLPTR